MPVPASRGRARGAQKKDVLCSENELRRADGMREGINAGNKGGGEGRERKPRVIKTGRGGSHERTMQNGGIVRRRRLRVALKRGRRSGFDARGLMRDASNARRRWMRERHQQRPSGEGGRGGEQNMELHKRGKRHRNSVYHKRLAPSRTFPSLVVEQRDGAADKAGQQIACREFVLSGQRAGIEG